MSTRYVWEISDVTSDKYKSEQIALLPAGQAIGGNRITFFKSYTFDETTGIYNTASSGTVFTPSSLGGFTSGAAYQNYPRIQDVGRYAKIGSSSDKMTTMYEAVASSGVWVLTGGGAISAFPAYNESPVRYSEIRVWGASQVSTGSSSVWKDVSSGDRNAYKDGPSQNGTLYYRYKGSDNLDPYEIKYNKEELEAGSLIAVNVVPRMPIYGGRVVYYYSYSIDGGLTWTNMSLQTADISKTVTIPKNATKFQARVLAGDLTGYTSTDYVYGPDLGVSSLKNYIGVSEKARSSPKLYIGVDGKAREITRDYVGVDDKARRW